MNVERAISDRFLTALLLACIIHALLILGVGFEMPKPEQIKKSLTITLVYNPSREAPEKADFLAQENQFGSGESREKTIPRIEPMPQKGVGHQIEPAPTPARTTEAKRKPVLKQERSEKKIIDAEGTDEHEEPQPHKLNLEALSQQIAEVSADFTQSRDTRARQPRIVYINSVNAHKYKAAAYEKAWQDKVERIGNLNYPDEARRQKLSGSLLLAVGIRPDGSIHSIKVRHSSGHPVLDDAAMRIVQLAAPFAAFPEELKQEADVLVITRTWRFYNDYRLETSP